MAYITLAQFKEILNLDVNSSVDDKTIRMILDETADTVEAYTGRNLSGTAKTQTDSYDFEPKIIIDNMDIQTLTSVSLDDVVLVKDTDYKCQLDIGFLELYRRSGNVLEVAYTYGLATTPGDVQTAFRIIAGQSWLRVKQERGNPKLAAERVGGLSTNFFAIGSENIEVNKAQNILDRYVRRE